MLGSRWPSSEAWAPKMEELADHEGTPSDLNTKFATIPSIPTHKHLTSSLPYFVWWHVYPAGIVSGTVLDIVVGRVSMEFQG
eukprot:365253-Chlamydomonas_euryale.AAC.8